MRFFIACLMVVVGFSGCAAPDGAEASDPTTSSLPAAPGRTSSEGAGDSRREPVTWTIDVLDFAYGPTELDIQVGDTVRWVHEGERNHTVTAGDGLFDSSPQCPGAGCMAQGEMFAWTFEEAGDVDYYCKLHPAMTGMVRVHEQFDGTPVDLGA